ncbi:uncharacterized protein LOC111089320 [Limulus polyphemus]|uniref:Uncharacterized protein LOC111089320 n=1 Tax=Limulus polyphemus TaxID=6850 RepID=A0ABM1TN49_LIMPO|nr:uncharacterized protein LOC111089320 [Limulus polyphemus]
MKKWLSVMVKNMPKKNIDKVLQKKNMADDLVNKKLNLEMLSSSESHVKNSDDKKIVTVKEEFPTDLTDERTSVSIQRYGLRKRKPAIPSEQHNIKAIKQEFSPRKSIVKKEPNSESLTAKSNKNNTKIAKSEKYTVNKERKKIKKTSAQVDKSDSKQQRDKSPHNKPLLTNQKFVGAHVSISGKYLENS